MAAESATTATPAPEPVPAPPVMGERRAALLALLLYFALAIVFTFPLITRMTSHIPGDNGDSITNLWGFWYFPRVWQLDASGFLQTNMQFYPDGVNLAFTTSSIVGALLMTPFSLALGAPFALNAWLLLHLAGGGWLIFLFCRQLDIGRYAAFAGGMAYLCSPFVTAHLPGHYTLVQIAYPALALYLLARLARTTLGDTHRTAWPTAIALGLSVTALAITDFYLTMMTLLVLLPAAWAHLAILHGTAMLKSTRYWQMMTLAVLVTAATFAPWIAYVWQSMQGHDYVQFDATIGNNLAARWSRLVNLPPYHYVWGPLLYGERSTAISAYNEYTYLGVVALFVGAVGLLKTDRPWQAAVWVVAFLLALGFGGGNSLTPEPEWRTGPLSFGRYWPTFFPFAEFRVPSRWHFALCAAVAVALALGTHGLLRALAAPDKALRRRVFMGVLPALLLFDLIRYPVPVFDASPLESGLDGAAEVHPNGVALDFPVGLNTGTGNNWGDWRQEALMRQMSHGMKSFSGHVSRHANNVIAARKTDDDFNALLAVQSNDTASTITLERDWAAFARRLNIDAVRIPRDLQTSATLRAIAEQMNPVWQWHEGADEITAY